jgi:hypothetical protein
LEKKKKKNDKTMLSVFLSSPNCCSLCALMQLLQQQRLTAQVTETNSIVDYTITTEVKEYRVESGFHIKLFELTSKEFEDRLWTPLKALMPLRCAFVHIPDEYTGCTSNWPGVFQESHCDKQCQVHKLLHA